MGVADPCGMGAFFEWWVPRSSTKRVVAASALVLVLIAGAAWLANTRATQSSASAQRALDGRADAINTEQARLSYWREREAMNEYLLTHGASILDEVEQRIAPSTTLWGGWTQTIATFVR